jgi:PadR family transcriptional regulator, regulatory protein PadR
MTRDLGDLEQLVLLAILRLGDEAYGVPILEEIRARTRRPASRAAVYIALRRLEDKGFVLSRLGDPTPERGGRAKRYYRARPAAVRQLRAIRRDLTKMWEDLPALESS